MNALLAKFQQAGITLTLDGDLHVYRVAHLLSTKSRAVSSMYVATACSAMTTAPARASRGHTTQCCSWPIPVTATACMRPSWARRGVHRLPEVVTCRCCCRVAGFRERRGSAMVAADSYLTGSAYKAALA